MFLRRFWTGKVAIGRVPFKERARINPAQCRSRQGIQSFGNYVSPFTFQDRERVDAVIKFWYRDWEDRGMENPPSKALMGFWFGGGNDAFITDTFGLDLDNIVAGKYESWENDRDGRLALIIILDQFSRSIYRGTAKAFEFDAKALELCETISNDASLWDSYKPYEKMYIILPYCHAEDPIMTKKAVELCEKLDGEMKRANPLKYEDGLNMSQMMSFMIDHHEIVQKFGRYPHRNEALGRTSTEEEIEYLKTAERYGQ